MPLKPAGQGVGGFSGPMFSAPKKHSSFWLQIRLWASPA